MCLMFHLYFAIQGEYIAPDKIENIYIKSPYVAQAFVHGHSLKVRFLHHLHLFLTRLCKLRVTHDPLH